MEPILLYDTTLRDGTQGENISFSADEKVKIAERLDDMGIHYIEGGWPGSNPKDIQFFDMAGRAKFKQARLAAFGATRKPGIAPEDDANLKALLETRQIGPIRITMIKPALDSLERIMGRLQETEPDIYASIGTAGALCVRLIRGSSSSISNHSWGTAVDLKLEGRLDGFGDGSTQFGLLIIAELFNEEGWFWGATYSREDSMHFEVGVETLRSWASAGLND